MEKQLWLHCKAEKGMFDSEVAVTVEAEGGPVSLFLPHESIQRRGSEALISVRLLDANEAFGLIELPRTPVTGSNVVKVRQRQLSAK
jgi:hypothetical protein